MTKKVRIENADTSDYKVIVEIWDKGPQNSDGSFGPDMLHRTVELNYPTAMTGDEVYLTSTRYIIVKEAAS